MLTRSGIIASGGVAGLYATITLDGIAIGSSVTEFSVVGQSGSFTFSFSSNPGNLFSLNGNQLVVAGLLSVGNIVIGIQATNGTVTLTQNFTLEVVSVANSWIPGIRPFSPTSPCNTLLSNSATYTPVAWPTATGFNYYTGVKFYFDLPDPSVTAVVSWLAPQSWGNPTQIVNRIMTPGFSGITAVSGVSDFDNEAVSFAGTQTVNLYNFTRNSDTTATSGAYAFDDIISGTGFGNITTGAGAGIVASGSNLMMGCLIKQEFTRYGDFNHWISFSMINTLTKPGMLAPGVGGGDGSNSSGLFQEGQLLAIPKTTAMPGGLSTYGQAMFRSMQNYGAWCMDTGGSCTPYMANSFQDTAGNWTNTDKGLLIADVNILFPLLQMIS